MLLAAVVDLMCFLKASVISFMMVVVVVVVVVLVAVVAVDVVVVFVVVVFVAVSSLFYLCLGCVLFCLFVVTCFFLLVCFLFRCLLRLAVIV